MSGCVKRTSGRFVKETRVSPPIPAKECVGQVRRGNDGNWYEPEPDKNGRYFWQLVGEESDRKPAPSRSSPAKRASAAKRASPSKASPSKKRKQPAAPAVAAACESDEEKTKCVRRTTAYYKNRNMPPLDAEECPNQERRGKNGRMYRSEFNEDLGIYKWYLTTKKASPKKSGGACSPKKTSLPATDDSLLSVFRSKATAAATRPDYVSVAAATKRPVVYSKLPADADRPSYSALPLTSATAGALALPITAGSAIAAAKKPVKALPQLPGAPRITVGPTASAFVPTNDGIVVGDFNLDELLSKAGKDTFLRVAFQPDGASAGATTITWPAPISGSATVFATQRGDGEYALGNGKTITVDGGHIFAVPESVWRKVRGSLGKSDDIIIEQAKGSVAAYDPRSKSPVTLLTDAGLFSTFVTSPDESRNKIVVSGKEPLGVDQRRSSRAAAASLGVGSNSSQQNRCNECETKWAKSGLTKSKNARLTEEEKKTLNSDFKKWAVRNHPDKGGDSETFADISTCRDYFVNDQC
jgi:hypothetical protein